RAGWRENKRKLGTGSWERGRLARIRWRCGRDARAPGLHLPATKLPSTGHNAVIHSMKTHASLRTFARHLWRDWIRALALPLLLIASAKSALADINYVPSGSMKPTILEGDVVFINKLAYDLRVPFTTARLARWTDPARGDIVVCFAPDDGMRLVKRVVGLPGDTIELRNDILVINGVRQSYAPLAADVTR